MLLALVVFLGAGFGGSFVGGVIYGQTLQDSESQLSGPLGAGGQFQGGGQGASGGGQRGQGGPGQAGGFSGAQGGAGQASDRQGGGPGNFGGSQTRLDQDGELAVARNREGSASARQEGEQGNTLEQQAAEPQVGGQDSQEGRQRVRPNQDNQAESPTGGAEPGPAAGTQTGVSQDSPEGPGGLGAGPSADATGRGGVAGAVQGLEGDVLTVASRRGELAVMLSESTVVYEVSETNREALKADTTVRVVGSRSPEGELGARFVVIVPDEVEGLFGAVGAPGGRQRGQAP